MRLDVTVGAIDAVLRRRIDRMRDDARAAIRRIEQRGPAIDRERQRVDDITRLALATIEQRTRQAAQGVGGCVWRLRALDPFATLDRGYAIVQRGATVVSSVGMAKPGDGVSVRVKDGTFGAHVDGGAGSVQRRKLKRRVPEAQAPCS